MMPPPRPPSWLPVHSHALLSPVLSTSSLACNRLHAEASSMAELESRPRTVSVAS